MNKLKQVDRKIIVGLSLTIVFLILWLLTMPGARNYNGDSTNSKSFIGSELNQSQKDEIYNRDVDNFNKALLYGDLSYCENINNKTMKKECKDTNPDQLVILNDNTAPKVSQEDADNYNKVLLYKDKIYCQNIIDEKLRGECESIMLDI